MIPQTNIISTQPDEYLVVLATTKLEQPPCNIETFLALNLKQKQICQVSQQICNHCHVLNNFSPFHILPNLGKSMILKKTKYDYLCTRQQFQLHICQNRKLYQQRSSPFYKKMLKTKGNEKQTGKDKKSEISFFRQFPIRPTLFEGAYECLYFPTFSNVG